MTKIHCRVLCTCTCLLILWVTPSFSQQPSGDELEILREEIEDLKKGQSAIQRELQEIKALLQGRRPAPAFREFVLNIQDEPFRGENEAPVVLVEFTDYQ